DVYKRQEPHLLPVLFLVGLEIHASGWRVNRTKRYGSGGVPDVIGAGSRPIASDSSPLPGQDDRLPIVASITVLSVTDDSL
ncbi:hypothetical protein, partial [Halorubrum tebenquichense]|uniref:hypothetical protein n=1 Tax=Halorubrum tebenquichense TaxID=119434 RepID=UPI0019D41203